MFFVTFKNFATFNTFARRKQKIDFKCSVNGMIFGFIHSFKTRNYRFDFLRKWYCILSFALKIQIKFNFEPKTKPEILILIVRNWRIIVWLKS